jgi:hypothetical protein
LQRQRKTLTYLALEFANSINAAAHLVSYLYCVAERTRLFICPYSRYREASRRFVVSSVMVVGGMSSEVVGAEISGIGGFG